MPPTNTPTYHTAAEVHAAHRSRATTHLRTAVDTHARLDTGPVGPELATILEDRDDAWHMAIRHLVRLGDLTTRPATPRAEQVAPILQDVDPTMAPDAVEVAAQLLVDGAPPWDALHLAKLLTS